MDTCEAFDFGCYLQWIFDEIDLLFLAILGKIANGIAFLIAKIPVPDFLTNYTQYVIPESVSYFADAFCVPFGLAVMTASLLARFTLRRIPFVG